MSRIVLILFALLSFYSTKTFAQENEPQLLIIGGGASGTTAGVQAARMGINTLIIEETPWLGGMLTSAGVAAIDGNHQMPSGLWGEFRQKLYDHYGGPKAVETGWVSNTLFEPSRGNLILKELAQEENLSIWYETRLRKIQKKGDHWEVEVDANGKRRKIKAQLVIDATELGDVLAKVGVAYDIGMDSREDTGEIHAPKEANDIIQDLTYVVILKDYGEGADKTIPKPKGYNREEFALACDVSDPAGDGTPVMDCDQMITYGKLPNGKYMINWPKHGNDIYLNIIENTPTEREKALEKAKLHSLGFIYFLQTELGFKNLGIAEGEFPTADGLPMIAYHRESRRMKGLSQLRLHHVAEPFDQEEAYYRTGVAVGDYTIDHHHLKNPDAPAIDFVKIKVPSYNVPLGSLIPQGEDRLIVAEKSISVSNIVNGATRLQPVVLGIGQAAGALAALSIQNEVAPQEVPVRAVQQALLDAGAYIMPYIDVKPQDEHFEPYQRIGATGILKGTGLAYKWANQTWLYPERAISQHEFLRGMQDFYGDFTSLEGSGAPLTIAFAGEVLREVDPSISNQQIQDQVKAVWSQSQVSADTELNRGMLAVVLDALLNPFALPIDHNGHLINKPQKPN